MNPDNAATVEIVQFDPNEKKLTEERRIQKEKETAMKKAKEVSGQTIEE